ncbi:MAG TPA: DNA-processing protein DprA [Polyangiales bacterium]|nr:DNA-processing protein DprA [Polyangiales bacterium]
MSARIPYQGPIRCIAPDAPGWPKALADLPDCPERLFVAGTLPEASQSVAIVGTRYASEDGLAFARKLAAELSVAGAIIVSGGAAGIDSAAHLGALDAGGKTVAVLATGLVDAYPKHNARLFATIAESGALVCETDRPARAGGWIFLRRNRLIAALAQVVVVVQAPHRSGALATARLARALKRRVFAVPSAPWDPRGTGCLQLLRSGAEICASAADILSLPTRGLGERSKKSLAPVKNANDLKGLGSSAEMVLRQLRWGPCHPDGIAAALDMKAAEVQEALLTLMLSGLCRQRADGNYVASS